MEVSHCPEKLRLARQAVFRFWLTKTRGVKVKGEVYDFAERAVHPLEPGKAALSSRSQGARYFLASSLFASASPMICSFSAFQRTVRPTFMAMLTR
jgi:hypothetical protein